MANVIKVALGKDSGKFVAVDNERLPAAVKEAIYTAGVKVILTNVYNGGGKEATPDQREAAVQKKLDAWYRGEFNIVTRGDSFLTAMREAYVDDIKSKTGASNKDVEQSIKATVASVFGEKESATFGKFIDAMAKLLAKANGSDEDAERDAFEAHYMKLAEEAAKKRTASAAKIDVTGLALDMFKKVAK